MRSSPEPECSRTPHGPRSAPALAHPSFANWWPGVRDALRRDGVVVLRRHARELGLVLNEVERGGASPSAELLHRRGGGQVALVRFGGVDATCELAHEIRGNWISIQFAAGMAESEVRSTIRWVGHSDAMRACSNGVVHLVAAEDHLVVSKVLAALLPERERLAAVATLLLLSGRWGEAADSVLGFSIAAGAGRVQVESVARALCVDRSTLFRRCRRESGAHPRRVVVASRLLMALVRRSQSGCGPHAIAGELGLSDPRQLSMSRFVDAFGPAGAQAWALSSSSGPDSEFVSGLLSRVDMYVLSEK